MKRKNSTLLVIALLTLFAAGLACNLPGGAVEPTPTPIPVSTESVGQMATQVFGAATQVAAGGPVTLEFTEQQLTSAAALEIQGQDEFDVQNIQVLLRDGLIRITGNVNQSGISLPLQVSMRVTPDSAGVPKTEVVEARVGPLPIPDSMTAQIEQSFNTAIQDELAAAGNKLFVDQITVAEGKMTIQAHTR